MCLFAFMRSFERSSCLQELLHWKGDVTSKGGGSYVESMGFLQRCEMLPLWFLL
jgi:hypothetical protein